MAHFNRAVIHFQLAMGAGSPADNGACVFDFGDAIECFGVFFMDCGDRWHREKFSERDQLASIFSGLVTPIYEEIYSGLPFYLPYTFDMTINSNNKSQETRHVYIC